MISPDATPLESRLRARLRAAGIALTYEDTFGQMHQLGAEAAEQLLAAMDPRDDGGAPADPAVVVTRADRCDPVPPGELRLEGGTLLPVAGTLPPGLPLGYHELRRQDGGSTIVIVSPGVCAEHPRGIWGWSIQLYSMWSQSSRGVGDLGDLRQFGTWALDQGAGVVLVNPLAAVVAGRPRGTSPYYPSSRRFLDPLYLRIGDVPGSSRVVEAANSDDHADHTDHNDHTDPADHADRAGPGRPGDGRIDREAVLAAKYRTLWSIWTGVSDAGHEDGFVRFRLQRGHALEQFAVFETLTEIHGGGWRSWPTRYRDPDSAAVTRFAREQADRIAFHCWVQWLSDEQLGAAAAAVPLMHDLPIGFDPNGLDAWVWQHQLASGVTVGAPPDELGPAGQDWQLPAFVPWKLRDVAYRPFIETIRSVFRHAAAVRIDHVLGLFRLFWVPEAGSTAGSYVEQDADALLDILALESQRAGVYVIGEDLGTVGPGVREELTRRGILGYRVFWFEEAEPSSWDRAAVGAITTHDLPSIGGLWSGAEADLQRRFGADPEGGRLERMRRDLATRAGIPPDAGVSEACVAAARMLGGAGCDITLLQIEDAVGSTHRINVPGTDERSRPENWSLSLPCSLEELNDHPTVARVVAAMRESRPDIDHEPNEQVNR